MILRGHVKEGFKTIIMRKRVKLRMQGLMRAALTHQMRRAALTHQMRRAALHQMRRAALTH